MSTVKSRTTDMTRGPIAKKEVFFAFPLMLGNLFQMMYNTADTIVVGNFVGKEALAAVGATSMITNLGRILLQRLCERCLRSHCPCLRSQG